MNSNEILSLQSYLPNSSPKKLVFMLHGYGDTAENFINIAKYLDSPELKFNYFALNAPTKIPQYPIGRQWFDLNPNGIYFTDATATEIEIIKLEILKSNRMLEKTITKIMSKYKLSYKDCFLMGFSQGAMMTFEFGNYFSNNLAGLCILSGCIIKKEIISNTSLLDTPIFISHGDQDNVLPIKNFEQACNFLKKNKLLFKSYKLQGDAHTISPKAINLLQKFIKNYGLNES